MRVRIVTRAALVRLAWRAGILVALSVLSGWLMFSMPGRSWSGPLPAPTEEETALAAELETCVVRLATEIGERSVARHEALAAAADSLASELENAGLAVERQGFPVAGITCENLVAEVPGAARPGEIVVVGGHYDSVAACPGANDNGTGAAATVALARAFAGTRPARTLRFVLFVNEEPPWFLSGSMGSLVYARRCRERDEDVRAMLSLETIGYYTDEPKSQRYPPPLSLFYPSKGDFIAFVGNLRSRSLVREVVRSFREHARFPSEGGAFPGWLPGIYWSDHWSFWQAGYRAIMVTDTAPFRYPHYHRPSDTPDKIDFGRTARVVAGLRMVIEDLAR